MPAEVSAARVCREAGAWVRESQVLRDLNVEVPASDARRIEVIANGLPFWGGKQVALDTTVVSALTQRGEARGRAPGQALREAQRTKEVRYPELVGARRCRLVVMAFEVGGRCSSEGVTFVRLLAQHNSLGMPAAVAALGGSALFQRWTGVRACAA